MSKLSKRAVAAFAEYGLTLISASARKYVAHPISDQPRNAHTPMLCIYASSGGECAVDLFVPPLAPERLMTIEEALVSPDSAGGVTYENVLATLRVKSDRFKAFLAMRWGEHATLEISGAKSSHLDASQAFVHELSALFARYGVAGAASVRPIEAGMPRVAIRQTMPGNFVETERQVFDEQMSALMNSAF